MSTKPLALSDQQLSVVREAACGVPVQMRERFLSCIADALTGRDVISDRELHDVVISAAVRFGAEDAA